MNIMYHTSKRKMCAKNDTFKGERYNTEMY